MKQNKLQKKSKYTKDSILTIIKENNCVSTTDLRMVNEYVWKIVRDNGWIDDLGLIKNKHENGYWTKERVFEVAKEYSNKNDFSTQEPTAYKWASYYGLLDKFVWMKCPTYEDRREAHGSVVYAFVDEENKVAYVGLTIDANNRAKSHQNDKKVQ